MPKHNYTSTFNTQERKMSRILDSLCIPSVGVR